MIKQILKVKRGIFELTWHDLTDFSKIKPISQVYGVCFSKEGKICIIKNPRKHWGLPGGKPEKGENFDQTLKREVKEEADIEIKDITPLGYQKVYHKDTKKTFYQLRYAAIISKIKPQTIDPSEKRIPKRKFIKPKDFLKYCPWGPIGKKIIKKAVKMYKEKN
ncbi:MAG: NUDIX domain-containing protein [Candidatus Pacearchaeota archaeon]|nr:MAG: NUDIX domain-containing protein [Candidatus Pacearchaeota archaeon]